MERSQLEPGDYLSKEINATGKDSIKLFIGQIPRTWEETDVRQILEPFGAIQDLSVLRDRNTGIHKGYYRINDFMLLQLSLCSLILALK